MDFSTIIFLLLAIVCWGASAVFDKMMLNYLEPGSAFVARVIFTILVFLPLAVWKFTPAKQAMQTAGKISVLFVFLSVAVSMSGVYFYFKAMSGCEASRIVPLASTYPLIAFFLAYLFLGESFTVSKLFGTFLVCSGVFFLSK